MTRAAAHPLPMPNWPALLDEALAAAYLDVSEGTFRLICAKAGLKPVDAYGIRVTRFRKTDLDALVDRLPARGATSDPEAPGAAAGVVDEDAVLARINARGQRRAGGAK